VEIAQEDVNEDEDESLAQMARDARAMREARQLGLEEDDSLADEDDYTSALDSVDEVAIIVGAIKRTQPDGMFRGDSG
jgi:hypothetical protein